jgi:AcrR family transcriptional regulator
MGSEDHGLDPATARQRLLDTADELFYNEGVHRVPMQRVIDEAGVSEQALQHAFGSREDLVRAYLRARHTRTTELIEGGLRRYGSARERLVGVFELQGQAYAAPGFRGCAFVTASAEALPDDVVHEAAAEYRDWVHNLFLGLSFDAQAPHPEELASQLVVLFDGAGVTAWMDHDPATVDTARAVATALVDAAFRA